MSKLAQLSPKCPLPPRKGKTALTNVRVFSGQNLTESTIIYMENGIIIDHVEGAVEVDGQEGELLPGLCDGHVHLHHPGHRQLAKWGVTTGLDMATWPAPNDTYFGYVYFIRLVK